MPSQRRQAADSRQLPVVGRRWSVDCQEHTYPCFAIISSSQQGNSKKIEENFEKFSELFSKYVEKFSSFSEELTIITDGVLPISYLEQSFARYISFDQPWGQDFEAPTFVGEFWVLSQYASSSSLLRFNFALENGEQIQGLYFSFDETKWPNSNVRKVRIVYSLSCSSNSEKGKVSLIIRHIEAL